MKSAIDKRDLILNIADQLIILRGIKRISLRFLRPISNNLFKLIMITLR